MKAELQKLRVEGRADMARQISEARDKGDLSENAEYDAAKEAQGLMEMKISEMENKVANARLIDEANIDPSKVAILSTVKIFVPQMKKDMVYMIVPEEEADMKTGKISVKSPISKALLGKKVGEKAEIQAPAGAMAVEIKEISR